MIFFDENKLPCSGLERKIFWLFVKTFFDAVVNTAFYVSRVNFFGKVLRKTFFFINVGQRAELFGIRGKSFFSAGLSNLHFTCP